MLISYFGSAPSFYNMAFDIVYIRKKPGYEVILELLFDSNGQFKYRRHMNNARAIYIYCFWNRRINSYCYCYSKQECSFLYKGKEVRYI